MLVMLNTLMDISEAESGTMQLQPRAGRGSPTSWPAPSISYRDVADAKGVTLDGASVRRRRRSTADRTRLEQVAANLIDNAVKYTPAGGRVDVEVRRDGGRAVAPRPRHRRRHPARRAAAHLGSAVPRRHQPHRARPRPRPEPRQGDRRGARRNGRGGQRAGPGLDVHRLAAARSRGSSRCTRPP